MKTQEELLRMSSDELIKFLISEGYYDEPDPSLSAPAEKAKAYVTDYNTKYVKILVEVSDRRIWYLVDYGMEISYDVVCI